LRHGTNINPVQTSRYTEIHNCSIFASSLLYCSILASSFLPLLQHRKRHTLRIIKAHNLILAIGIIPISLALAPNLCLGTLALLPLLASLIVTLLLPTSRPLLVASTTPLESCLPGPPGVDVIIVIIFNLIVFLAVAVTAPLSSSPALVLLVLLAVAPDDAGSDSIQKLEEHNKFSTVLLEW
jgi:hypothetical protein